jgi:2-methylisocitrate lyase-like PEP mutase family enzyme
MPTQAEKGTLFRDLHYRNRAFIISNPWDAGGARLLQSLGFEALASTSAGFAFSIGKRDSAVGRDTMMAHAAALVAATDLPVSADLENCYADDPAGVAETVRMLQLVWRVARWKMSPRARSKGLTKFHSRPNASGPPPRWRMRSLTRSC